MLARGCKLMNEECVPYQRKPLYLFLTIPMIALYAGIAVFLWTINIAYLVVYGVLFVLVALFQSYVCVYYQCPYIGKFAPCVGGFCLPSSQIARLFKNVKMSETTYNVVVTLAFLCFTGIIFFPMYFLYQHNLIYMLLYSGIVLAYASGFLLFICPVCGTRHVCPGGQTAVKLRERLPGKDIQPHV
jgi:hypothetical protein